MNNSGPRNYAWGTPCFNVPQLEKNFEFYYMTVLELCLLLLKEDLLNQSAVLELCTNVIIWGGKSHDIHKIIYILIHAQKSNHVLTYIQFLTTLY